MRLARRDDARRAALLAETLAAADIALPAPDRRTAAPTAPARLPAAEPAVAEPAVAPAPVEITIGRIEVRATTQQARPEPVAPAVSTLDDYLRRRARSR